MHAARQILPRRPCGVVLALLAAAGNVRAQGEWATPRQGVRGGEVRTVEVEGENVGWNDLEKPRDPGRIELRWHVLASGAGQALELPVCAGRGPVTLDGALVPATDSGPMLVPLSEGEHVVSARVTISAYEKRIACGEPARLGLAQPVATGLQRLGYPSGRAGGGHAAVFVPTGGGKDPHPGRAMLVLPHPWNGSIWTYAAYAELLDEAERRDLVLLFPTGLGNSLYTAAAESEVMDALGAAEERLGVDRARISIAGASMGGAGATTIGFHHPDVFASITSFFGDSRYDLATYVRPILRDEEGAHLVNAADVADNARNVPVWLVHGEADRVSPIAQSEILAHALATRGFDVRFDRVPDEGHSGALFARFARALVGRASEARAPVHPPRVSFRSVRAGDRCAYGVCLERVHQRGDAFFDVERAPDGTMRVHRTENVSALRLEEGALGLPAGRFLIDPRGDGTTGSWSAR